MQSENFYKNLIIEFDDETSQYSVFNDTTPGIYGIGENKHEAVKDYLSCLYDACIINLNIKNENLAFA